MSKYVDTQQVLGSGAFGKVVKVVSYDTGLAYAKKICTRKGHYLENTEIEKNIMETLASGDRAHKGFHHIVQLVDAERNDQNTGWELIMELYQCTLLELMEAQHVLSDPSDPDSELILNALPEAVVKDVARHISLGIAYMNSLGYSHCDIKPENILCKQSLSSESGYHFSVADFGNVSKKMAYFHRIQTLQYTCTENLLGVSSVKNCDMPSLACVLYEAVTGEYLVNLNHEDTDAHILTHLNAIGFNCLNRYNEDEIPAIKPYYDRISSRCGYLGSQQYPLQKAMERAGYKNKEMITDLIACMLIPFPKQRISADLVEHSLFADFVEDDEEEEEVVVEMQPVEEVVEEVVVEMQPVEADETQSDDEEAQPVEGEKMQLDEDDETDVLKKIYNAMKKTQIRKKKRSKYNKKRQTNK